MLRTKHIASPKSGASPSLPPAWLLASYNPWSIPRSTYSFSFSSFTSSSLQSHRIERCLLEPLADCWCWATSVEAHEGADRRDDAGHGHALSLLLAWGCELARMPALRAWSGIHTCSQIYTPRYTLWGRFSDDCQGLFLVRAECRHRAGPTTWAHHPVPPDCSASCLGSTGKIVPLFTNNFPLSLWLELDAAIFMAMRSQISFFVLLDTVVWKLKKSTSLWSATSSKRMAISVGLKLGALLFLSFFSTIVAID